MPQDQSETSVDKAENTVAATVEEHNKREVSGSIALSNTDQKAQEVDLATQLIFLKSQLEALQAQVNNTKEAETSATNQTSQDLQTGSSENNETAADPTVQHKKTEGGVRILEDPTKPEEIDTTATEADSPAKEVIPKLNRVRWSDFKNTSLDEKQAYAIDVLMGPAKFYWERHKEERNAKRSMKNGLKISDDVPQSLQNSIPVEGQPQKPQDIAQEVIESQNEMPERIRINCERLLMILRDITDSALNGEPVVLLRPYKLLIHHEHAIRQWLQDLEAKWPTSPHEKLRNGRLVDDDSHEVVIGASTDDVNQEIPKQLKAEAPTDTGTTSTEMMESYEALQSLRCLVKFMDKDVVPVHQQYKATTHSKIYFRDLWHLYRPGDLVVSWKDLDNKNSATHGISVQELSSSDQNSKKGPAAIWRVLQVSKGRPVLGAPHSSDDEIERLRAPTHRINKLSILCYMIAYNGKSFGPVDHTFEISPFEGQREINSLDPCPAKHLTNFEELSKRLIARGKKFTLYTQITHCLYAGFTLSSHPSGIPCKVADKTVLVDGHVIVDFKEAYREDSRWVVQQGMPEASGGSGLESTEDYPRYIWKDRSRNVLHTTASEQIHDDNHIDIAEMEDFVTSSTFLCAFKDATGDNEVDERTLEEVDYALLPDRVVGFDLHRRKFGILALDCLHPVQVKREGWADLKLPRGHKHMVQAQVKTHFMEKRLRQLGAQNNLNHDIVRGKGQGLIILLHGAPGVGKTSTAECVAESLQKPLYPITCGDLGVTASVVEETLSSTFAKAETWDCVLLLDEADVFLAQRTRTDLKRNAIVSVFLRVLEYYRGVLMLTTNRVGAFDEAFKSRIHLHLYYPALNKDQTLAIWRMNMDRVVERKQGNIIVDADEIMQFADAHFEHHKTGNTRWNGRQIRNAYQTALAMAEYEGLEGLNEADWEKKAMEGNVKAHLKVSHFRTVADASSQFDSYIEETIGTTDSGRAFTDRDRADHFKWMRPSANNHSQHYSGQWSHGGQGGGSMYAEPKVDPFVRSSQAQHSGFSDMNESAPAHASHFQGQTWPGASQPWTGAPTSTGRPTGESKSPIPHVSRGAETYFPQQDAGHAEQFFPQSRYGQHSDARPLAPSPHYGPNAGVQAPSTLNVSQAQQLNASFRPRPSSVVSGDDGY